MVYTLLTHAHTCSQAPLARDVSPILIVLPPGGLLVARLRDCGAGGLLVAELEGRRQVRLERAERRTLCAVLDAPVRALALVEKRLVALWVATEEDAGVGEQEGRGVRVFRAIGGDRRDIDQQQAMGGGPALGGWSADS